MCALEDAGFTLKDNLAWLRTRAPHRAQRLSVVYEKRNDIISANTWDGWRIGNLRPTFEPILWFCKPYKIGTTIADNVLKYGVGGYNESAYQKYVQTPDNVIESGMAKNEGGLHPTQKPLHLMQALIELTTQEQHVVLDPFAGSGTTLVAAKMTDRHYIGFEAIEEYVDICKKRLNEVSNLIY